MLRAQSEIISDLRIDQMVIYFLADLFAFQAASEIAPPADSGRRDDHGASGKENRGTLRR
jgi:hypothetical protein